ncbi:MAG: alpha/beta hydrolase [Steroidobacteraceae bacterium]|jgi:acetyl esterase/lipase
MPLDPRVKRFLDALAAGNPPNARTVSVPQRRAQLIELMKFGGVGVPAGAPIGHIEEATLPGPTGPLNARIYSPHPESLPMRVAAGLLPGLTYFHGGGLVAGSLDTHASIARALCHWGGCRIIAVDYRLAPEHPFPAGLDDTTAAIAYVGSHAADFGIDVTRLGVCGDSAGGTLVAAACHALARSGDARPALQLLICPILDYSRRTGSRADFVSGYLIDQDTLDHDLAYYAPRGADPQDPRISPLLAEDLSGVPPTIVHTAEFDPLRDEGQDYFRRLSQSGSGLAYTCHPGMIHLFYGLGAVIPYARTALEKMGAEIRAALTDPGAIE